MKKVLVILVTLIFITSTTVSAGGWDFSNSSDWAIEELENAMINGIAPMEYDNYQRNITRAEFAELVMNLFYQTTGAYSEPASYSTFTDTEDNNILMAFKLGIIKGKGNGMFAPNDAVTRQEMAIMMKRAIDSMGITYTAADGVLTVSDKANVASWAVDGVDFAFDKGFMKGDGINFNPLDTTPIEQGVIIINRVYEEYRNKVSNEPNDYTKGYTLKVTTEGLQVTYNNNNKSEIIISNTLATPLKGGGAMYFEQFKDIKTIDLNLSKVYFLDGMNRLFTYDFKDGTCYQYTSSYGGALNVQQYKVVSSGDFYGFVAVETLGYGKTKSDMYAFDRDGKYIGNLEMMTDLNYQIGEIYTQIDEEKNKFTIDVTNAINFPGEINVEEEGMHFFSSANHYTYVEDGTGYLRMYPYSYDNNDYNGPIGRAGVGTDMQIGFNGYGGFYEVDMQFNTEKGNGGIVFNLKNASNGNDNYTGYYVGLSPENDIVMIGRSQWKWTNLKEASLGYDLGTDDTVTLKVVKNGSDITVYVDGRQYISISDNTYMDDGGFGVRTWNSDVTYSNFTINPLPY
ncbi:hypothetical protein J2Z76_001171 [Sedimentibacter acidaminivorans]|uniref:SLH domain-containing protein n=1 Tax=Sedimentibacter acidaminivorans TaxID=913099 RepID=A0ABS4GC99_9FIRM|nr:S-layer homology domain-containing protein [Sedimentibacter acidaminivorans]MBP1925312.1 hypothetical protein [Sedimentibacter acidaminivorans]